MLIIFSFILKKGEVMTKQFILSLLAIGILHTTAQAEFFSLRNRLPISIAVTLGTKDNIGEEVAIVEPNGEYTAEVDNSKIPSLELSEKVEKPIFFTYEFVAQPTQLILLNLVDKKGAVLEPLTGPWFKNNITLDGIRLVGISSDKEASHKKAAERRQRQVDLNDKLKWAATRNLYNISYISEFVSFLMEGADPDQLINPDKKIVAILEAWKKLGKPRPTNKTEKQKALDAIYKQVETPEQTRKREFNENRHEQKEAMWR